MAPASSGYKPWRALVALAAVIIGMAAWAFWPGTETSIRLGLDLRGGTQVILVPRPVTEGTTVTDEQLKQAVEILRQRVDGLGVAEAEITTQGTGSGAAIVVSVPGENDDRIVELVQRTALLNFRPVWDITGPSPTVATDGASPAATGAAAPEATDAASPQASVEPTPEEANPAADNTASPSPTASPAPATSSGQDGTIVQAADNTAEFQTEVAALNCTDPLVRAGGTPDDPTKWLGTCDVDGLSKYSLQPAFILGTNVTGAQAQLAQGGIGWEVALQFDNDGAKKLAEVSTQLVALPECGQGQSPCNAFAIVLDGVVVSSPRFNQAITGGQASITGNFTAQEAQDLANVLKYGALPVTLDAVDVTTISPTVGDTQLRAGILAGLFGLGLVVIYLLIYYRALGLVAVASLLIAAGMLYLTFVILSKTVGLTLTLAGVAGAIVAIGITADSFIVYFERIRDEIRDGRSLRQAADTGWIRARRTLLAADFVSLLAAVVLYFLSVGSVRGFAFVLGITTILDVVVAFWFTHPIVVLLGRSKWMQKGSALTGLSPERIGHAAGVVPTGKRGRVPVAASNEQEVTS